MMDNKVIQMHLEL